MSVFFRTGPGTGVGVPFWLVPPAAAVWLTAMFIAWLAMLLILGALLILRAVAVAYRKLNHDR